MQDYELRRYSKTVWVSTNIAGVDFAKAETEDFHRLFDYIQGKGNTKGMLSLVFTILTLLPPGASMFHKHMSSCPLCLFVCNVNFNFTITFTPYSTYDALLYEM